MQYRFINALTLLSPILMMLVSEANSDYAGNMEALDWFLRMHDIGYSFIGMFMAVLTPLLCVHLVSYVVLGKCAMWLKGSKPKATIKHALGIALIAQLAFFAVAFTDNSLRTYSNLSECKANKGHSFGLQFHDLRASYDARCNFKFDFN